jgi:hypothetical protein
MLRRTAAEWERILSAYDASGLSVAGFARSWGVTVATLRWRLWRRQTVAADATVGSSAVDAGFVELVSPEQTGWSPGCEVTVTFGSGSVVRLSSLPPAAWLHELVTD